MDNEMLEIIARILSGEACLEDKQKLINWLGQEKTNIRAFGEVESLWNALEIIATGKNYNSKDAFCRFKELVNKKTPVSGHNRFRSTKIDWILRIAAIIVITFGLSYFLIRSFQNNLQTDKSICEVVAPRGSKAQLLLPDGTKVWLNADSKINYNTDFNKKTREIYIEGEGYFEIAKNPGKPFVVNTSDIRIKALGTTFNVRSYPGENTIEATLIEGRVELEKILFNNEGEKLLTLKPNQKAIYYISNEKIVSGLSANDKKNQVAAVPTKENKTNIVLDEKVNTEISTAWKNNRLCFENESFQNLAVMLERRFDVNIHFTDENVKQYHFSGKFGNIIIDQVLSALQYASPFYYFINENDIYISDKPLKDSNSLELLKMKTNIDQIK
jgi:transmembrane sensor